MMSLETWYLIFLWGWRISMGLVVVTLAWHCISNMFCESTKSFIAFAIAGVIAAGLAAGYFITESKLYPPGNCPNCEQQVTTRYCEDCGWENDSYFEQTDNK